MSTNGASFPTRVADVLSQLGPHRPDILDTLRAFYTDDIVFRDPIQEVRGIDAFIAMNRRLVRRMRTLQWTVTTAKGDDHDVFLEWTMRGKTKLGPTVKVDGMTHARARDGRIYDHRDYWDIGELMVSAVPGGQRMLHTVLSPLA
jgi:limonene-1,2-epoxide hydrolase